jgi:hypothetical protein
MKHTLVIIATAALTTTACAPMLNPYAAGRSPYRVRRYAAAPQPVNRWDIVMRLPATAIVDVLTMDGIARTGRFVAADVKAIRIHADAVEQEIPKVDVMRIDLVDLPGSDAGAVLKKGARSALLGIAGMTVVAAVIGGEAWPPPGVLVRAGAAGGAWSGGQREMLRRQPRIIYLAPASRY